MSSTIDGPAPRTNTKCFRAGRFLRNAVIIVGVVAVCVMVWEKGLKNNVFPKNFGVVTEGEVYRSGVLTPWMLRKTIESRHIKTVVDLGAFVPGSDGDAREERIVHEFGAERVSFMLAGDATGDPNIYVDVLRIMRDPAKQPVLVHCAAGSQRTGCAVALYRNIVDGVPMEAAYAEAARYGHSEKHNPYLRQMLDSWREAIAHSLKTDVPIPYDPMVNAIGGAAG